MGKIKNQKLKIIPPVAESRRTSHEEPSYGKNEKRTVKIQRYQRYFSIFGLCFWFLIFDILFFSCSKVYCEDASIYDSHGKRDPFVPLVGVASKAIGSLEDVMSIEDVHLQGIASDLAGEKIVIINGELIKEGKTIGHLTIKSISEDSVILTIDEDEYQVYLYVNPYKEREIN